mgnify:CR=1 FL=1
MALDWACPRAPTHRAKYQDCRNCVRDWACALAPATQNNTQKKKYKAKIVGFKDDKHRIPNIDILVENNQIWKGENFEAKIIHIPGHTTGHICFYFSKEKMIFTGDTLFSLGCGRIFEGTYEQMFNALKKITKLPANTNIYCGHEYTLSVSYTHLTLPTKRIV